MNLLFFDCETNGLPIDYKASYTDVNNWPRVLSLSWILTDICGNILNQHYSLIRPDGWGVPTEKFWVDHGYTQAENMEKGLPIAEVIEKFMADKHQAAVLVAHNLNFDHRIVWAEIIRLGLTPKSGMHKICTMMKSTSHCRLPGKNGKGYKWPKLEELYQVLFQKSFDGAHNALADVEACRQSFFELMRLGVISINPEEILV